MNKALQNYECDGQLSFAFNGNIAPCPYIRECGTYGIGCQGTSYWCKRFDKAPEPFMNPPEEPIYKLDIKGICDDPYCPQCGYEFETTRTCKNYEVDCERCPECHVKVDWAPWHRLND